MGINISDGMRYMPDYRVNDIPKVSVPNSAVPQIEERTHSEVPSKISIEPIQDDRPRSVDPRDVSLSFNKQESFGYIGRDKDVSLLDMEKAISMMRQDTILQDYQFFVGNNRDIFNSEDGRVISTDR